MIYWYTPQNSKKSWHHPFRIHRYHRCIFHLNQRQWATPHPSTKNTQPVPRGCQCKALDLLLRQVLQPWVTLRCHSSYHSSYHFKYIYIIYIYIYAIIIIDHILIKSLIKSWKSITDHGHISGNSSYRLNLIYTIDQCYCWETTAENGSLLF